MFAVIKTGGKQYKVAAESQITVMSLQGEAGAIVPPDEYFPKVREICDKWDILFIADEVQTGMGRCGTLWGIDRNAVVHRVAGTPQMAGYAGDGGPAHAVGGASQTGGDGERCRARTARDDQNLPVAVRRNTLNAR